MFSLAGDVIGRGSLPIIVSVTRNNLHVIEGSTQTKALSYNNDLVSLTWLPHAT